MKFGLRLGLLLSGSVLAVGTTVAVLTSTSSKKTNVNNSNYSLMASKTSILKYNDYSVSVKTEEGFQTNQVTYTIENTYYNEMNDMLLGNIYVSVSLLGNSVRFPTVFTIDFIGHGGKIFTNSVNYIPSSGVTYGAYLNEANYSFNPRTKNITLGGESIVYYEFYSEYKAYYLAAPEIVLTSDESFLG